MKSLSYGHQKQVIQQLSQHEAEIMWQLCESDTHCWLLQVKYFEVSSLIGFNHGRV